jgi:folate-dependent phosphoribosylglycinamide formyltransferase PurN
MKLIELWRHLKEVEVDSVAEAGHLVILTVDILDAVNTILECQ